MPKPKPFRPKAFPFGPTRPAPAGRCLCKIRTSSGLGKAKGPLEALELPNSFRNGGGWGGRCSGARTVSLNHRRPEKRSHLLSANTNTPREEAMAHWTSDPRYQACWPHRKSKGHRILKVPVLPFAANLLKKPCAEIRSRAFLPLKRPSFTSIQNPVTPVWILAKEMPVWVHGAPVQ